MYYTWCRISPTNTGPVHVRISLGCRSIFHRAALQLLCTLPVSALTSPFNLIVFAPPVTGKSSWYVAWVLRHGRYGFLYGNASRPECGKKECRHPSGLVLDSVLFSPLSFLCWSLCMKKKIRHHIVDVILLSTALIRYLNCSLNFGSNYAKELLSYLPWAMLQRHLYKKPCSLTPSWFPTPSHSCL